tara:strand:- start:158 stop:538 length:381 start_codon:yes stop_codon:yes gene_type:complete
MANFAKLGPGNIVERVEVVVNDIATTEQAGVEFLQSLYGKDTVWKQTSYNATIRKNYAGIGYTYNVEKDAFIGPQPYRGWKLNEETCKWEAPIAYPNTFTQNLTDENGDPMADMYYWNESKLKWEL